MKFLTIIIPFALIILIKFIIPLLAKKANNDTTRPATDKKPKPGDEIPNDKMVIVSHTSYEDLKTSIVSYCNLYNKEDWAALPRLTKTQNEFIITFPYDIEFELFCFFVNYIAYPANLKTKPVLLAWTTTKPTDTWITTQSSNKKVMLFIPENDKEYDNVFLTTEDNIGYKLGFASWHQKQLSSPLEKNFTSPKFDVANIASLEFEDFE